MRVLNVGGNNFKIPIPGYYEEWEHHILDITEQATFKADILDVIHNYKPILNHKYNAIYCSHFLEHFNSNNTLTILKWMHEQLEPNGFVEILVPDFKAVVKRYLTKESVFDTLYNTISGKPINTLDVVMGEQQQVLKGNEYQRHRMLFDNLVLRQALSVAGFIDLKDESQEERLELHMIGYKDADS